MENNSEDRVPNEVCSLNFSFLTNAFGKTYGVNLGRKILNEGCSIGIHLPELLRHHSQRKVRGVEVQQRDSIDELLSFYCILEIGALVGYFRMHQIGPQLSEVYRHLANPSLSKYYQEYYPLTLLKGLLRRFESTSMPREKFQPNTTFPTFINFLLLSQEMKNDEEIKAFLLLLDSSYDITGLDLFDFKSVLTDKEKLWKLAGLKPSRGPQYKALRGYARFITFSIEFDRLLQSISEFPIFQSACYQYHKNHYQRFGKLLGELTAETAVLLLQHQTTELHSNEASGLLDSEFGDRFAEADRVSGADAIRRLSSGQYWKKYEIALLPTIDWKVKSVA